MVVAAVLVSRGIKAVADGDDVNHEALRRRGVIKVVRIAAFAVVELVVASGDIHIARQILVDAQVLPAAVRVGADDAELLVRQRTVLRFDNCKHGILAHIVQQGGVMRKLQNFRAMRLHILRRCHAVIPHHQRRFFVDDGGENRLRKGGYHQRMQERGAVPRDDEPEDVVDFLLRRVEQRVGIREERQLLQCVVQRVAMPGARVVIRNEITDILLIFAEIAFLILHRHRRFHEEGNQRVQTGHVIRNNVDFAHVHFTELLHLRLCLAEESVNLLPALICRAAARLKVEVTLAGDNLEHVGGAFLRLIQLFVILCRYLLNPAHQFRRHIAGVRLNGAVKRFRQRISVRAEALGENIQQPAYVRFAFARRRQRIRRLQFLHFLPHAKRFFHRDRA